jgi:hypothetical protein
VCDTPSERVVQAHGDYGMRICVFSLEFR